MIEGYRIICFGDEEWGFTGTVQRMARALVKKNELIYITSLGIRRPRLTRADLAKMGRRLRTWLRGRDRTEGSARVISPLGLPFYQSRRLTGLSAFLVYKQLCRLGVFPLHPRTILWIALPTAAPILRYLRQPPYFYHATDRHSAYPGASRALIQSLEDELARGARFCVGASEQLTAALRGLNSHSYFIDHGVNFQHLSQLPAELPKELNGLPRPIVGYVGGITEWVDQEALLVLARTRPNWSLVLVGKKYVNMGALLRCRNVYWPGFKPYAELPRYLAGLDVCLLPRKLNEWEAYANPLKLLEYFCTGNPVVASALPAALYYGSLVYIYREASEIVAQIEEALREPPDQRSRRQEIARAKAHPHEVEELSVLIERHLLAAVVKNPDDSAHRRPVENRVAAKGPFPRAALL